MIERLPRRAGAVAALLLTFAAACSDRTLTGPAEAPAPAMSLTQCRVNVPAQTMTCAPVASPGGSAARGDRILGGQEVYVKLASSGTAWDAGTEILSSNVTVQNLTRQSMGTDGVTTSGVKVFFASGPEVTGGSGTVSVTADGTDTFTGGGQPYYLYSQALTPYQVSSARQWLFNVPGTVVSFVFTVYVSAPMTGAAGSALLDRVWTGAVSSDWFNAGNWTGGVPDSLSTVSIPADSLLASHTQPVLTANAEITNLRVGYASSLGLAGFTLTARGNVDATGAVSGGTVRMSGTGAVVNGTVNALVVSGSGALQGSTKATGAVSVTGSLSVKNQALNISIP